MRTIRRVSNTLSPVPIAFLFLSILCSCVPQIPRDALQLRPESLALRQLQTRKFETKDEKKLLVAGAGVLQDLGFNIDESETALGVIVGSKDRDATDTGQVVGALVLAILTESEVEYDTHQKIRASVVTAPQNRSVNLRVTFQRIIWNSKNQISRTESLEDPILYQEFFDKLSKSVFLEAHQL